MAGTIMVDKSLGNVKELLEIRGYEVLNLDGDLQSASVVVISGLKEDYLGYANTLSEARIIDASGLSAEQVLEEVEKAVKLRYS